jgi:hypothetical protein
MHCHHAQRVHARQSATSGRRAQFLCAARIYGFVETAHQTILHAILDTAMGWSAAHAIEQPTRQIA